MRPIMIEQPFGNGDLIEHTVLQRQLKTPICIDESAHNINQIKATLALGSCRVVNLKPPRVGGPRNVSKMTQYLQSQGIGAWIGGMLETGIGRSLNLACASLEGINFAGDLRPPLDYLSDDITNAPFHMAEDQMKIPEAPGLGVLPDPEKLERYTVETFLF